jgi:hypothetical protein
LGPADPPTVIAKIWVSSANVVAAIDINGAAGDKPGEWRTRETRWRRDTVRRLYDALLDTMKNGRALGERWRVNFGELW